MNANLAYQEEIYDEMINGQIVLMSPSPMANHVYAAGNIYRIFADYLKGKICTPFPDRFDLYLSEKDRFEPDMMIVCDPNKIKSRGVYGAPDLVVEVLSRSTSKRDRGYKKNAYEKAGVKEYWLVDTNNQSIEQYILTDGYFVLQEIYSLKGDYDIEDMTEEEKAAIVKEFKCSLYDDLVIKLDDVFERVK